MKSEGTPRGVVKFLVLRFSSIGDIVLTTPVVRCLKEQYPGAEIHYVVKKKFGMVLEHNPYIDKLHYLDGNLNELVEEFRKERFDYIIDLHKTLRSYWLRVRLGRKTLTFRKLSVEKLLLTKLHIDLMPKGVHIVERNLRALASLGIINDGKPVDYFLAASEEVPLSELPGPFSEGYVAFVVGGQHFTKRLPREKIAAICRLLNRPVILLGGPEDSEVASYVVSALPNGLIFDACGKYSFNQSVSLLKQARVVLTHDTGLMHISGAFNKPVVSVWGATSPVKFGVWPYLNTNRAEMVVPGLDCHPCSNFGTATCPRGHFRCMLLQNETAISAETLRMFQGASGKGEDRDFVV